MFQRALSGSGGGSSRLYVKDITLSRSNKTTIDCGFIPKVILLFDRTDVQYYFIYGYIGNYAISGKNAFIISSQSGYREIGNLGSGDFNDTGRGSIHSVNSTEVILNEVTFTNYPLEKRIIIIGEDDYPT